MNDPSPRPADRSTLRHLLNDDLLPLCHRPDDEGGYTAVTDRDRVTCPRCLDLLEPAGGQPVAPSVLADLAQDVEERRTVIMADPALLKSVRAVYGPSLHRLLRIDVGVGDGAAYAHLAALVGALVSDAVEQERERVRTQLDVFFRNLDAGDR